jgi:hypothetical protein
MTPTAQDVCASRGCRRVLTGTVIADCDGLRYCKRHGDRLPPWKRHPRPRGAAPALADSARTARPPVTQTEERST